MNRLPILIVCICSVTSCVAGPVDLWNSVIFRDDFDYSVGGIPDPNDWVVNHPEAPDPGWWTQGRTHFPNPALWNASGEFPRIEDGACIIEHHLYDPYASNHQWFLGGEVRTVMGFQPNRAYRFEARVRCYSDRCASAESPCVPYPDGLVTSFFLYGYDGATSDELDFEFLSKLTNDPNYAAADPLLTDTWDESSQFAQCVAPGPDGLDLSEWNTFRIYWYPDPPRVEWTWLDPVNGETTLRTELNASFIPDEPMSLYFNFWAPPAGDWQDPPCNPYDGDLQPVDDPSQNESSGYEIDYVEVRVRAFKGTRSQPAGTSVSVDEEPLP